MPELERALRELGGEVVFPATPDVATAVRGRLAAEPARPPRRAPWRRPLVLAAATLLLALAAAMAVPGARTAILKWLGIGGVSVERVETLPETRRWQQLAPGRRVSFAEAERATSFRILTPPPKGRCRRCGTVLLDRSVPGGMVTFVWPGATPVLLLSEFRGAALLFIQKSVGPRTRLEPVVVNGNPGYWISGAHHAVVFRDVRGRVRELPRLAGNVLLWVQGGVTFRLEGDIPKRQALDLAHALR